MLTQEQIDDMLNASREMDEGPTALVRRIESAVREQCAVAAWSHYMDTCRRLQIGAATAEEWNATASVRKA